MDEVVRWGATLNVFMLGDDPGLARFVDAIARRSGGRVFTPDIGRWGSTSSRTTCVLVAAGADAPLHSGKTTRSGSSGSSPTAGQLSAGSAPIFNVADHLNGVPMFPSSSIG